MNEEHDPKLDAAYRRASESEAGRPAPGTRAAILQEARTVAQQRTPASNDSRYIWRAVAVLAVIGVGVLIWRQADVRLPGEAPDRMVTAEAQDESGYVADPQVISSEGDAAPGGGAPRSVAQAQSGGQQKAQVASASAASARPGELAAPVSSAAQGSFRAAESSLSSPPAEAMAQSGGAGAPAAPSPATVAASERELAQLLRAHFPTQFQSSQFHRVWMLRDADGQVLLSGELESGRGLRDAETQIGRGLIGQTPGPWRVQQLRNAAGQLIEVAVSVVELGEPRE